MSGEKETLCWAIRLPLSVEAEYKSSQDEYTAKRDIGHSSWQGLWVLFQAWSTREDFEKDSDIFWFVPLKII